MKLRWWIGLPFSNLALDCLALCLWLWHANAVYRPKAEVFQLRMKPVLFFQESGSVTFDPKSLPPPAEFLVFSSGTLPALLVSGAMRPEAQVLTPKKLWDPIWFVIHEAVSFLLWFGIGLAVESGFFRAKKSILAYLGLRSCFASLLIVHGIANFAWRLQVLAWLAFGIYVAVVCLHWTLSKISSLRAAA